MLNSFFKLVALNELLEGYFMRLTPIPIARYSLSLFDFKFSIRIPAHLESLIIISFGHFKKISLSPLLKLSMVSLRAKDVTKDK